MTINSLLLSSNKKEQLIVRNIRKLVKVKPIEIIKRKVYSITGVIFVILISIMATVVSAATYKVWSEPKNLVPNQWYVIGAFPNAMDTGLNRTGLDEDFLTQSGGETKARFTSSTKFTYGGKVYAVQPASFDSTDSIDLKAIFNKETTDYKVAYAYTEWTVKKAVQGHALFGSDDGTKVWLNGKLIHSTGVVSRQLILNSDQFEIPLVTGKNRLLVKVENGTGEWGFAIKVINEEGKRRIKALEIRRNLDGLDPGPEKGSFILNESFPPIVWRNSHDANLVFGNHSIKVRWFGPDLKEVERPEKQGRYAAIMECTTLDGYVYRRALSFSKVPANLVPDIYGPPFNEMPMITVPDSTLSPMLLNDIQKAEFSRYIWRAMHDYTQQNENAAIALATMAEETAPVSNSDEPDWLNSGFIKNADYQLAVRMKLEGRKPKTLTPPKVMSTPAPELMTGTEKEAGIKSGTIEKLREVCRAWIKDDPNGFVVLVAHQGVVFMHEGYGDFNKDSKFYPASIGKSIAGLTFARAVDQGLISFDEPVGNVLTDWKGKPDSKVTYRWCFNHLTGLSGHATHFGLFNAYLDNSLYMEDAIFEQPGLKHRYNGDNYNLTGKALELTIGKTMWRLLYENLQKPFGEPVTQYDLGFGNLFNAQYLGKVGQMLLQDGKYGKYQFYSPGFVKTLLPQRVADHAPEINDKKLEWGIGLTWMPDPPESREKGVLGPNVFGHGAASNSVWRVDPDHNLVIVIGRNKFKDSNSTNVWAAKFAKVLAEGLEP